MKTDLILEWMLLLMLVLSAQVSVGFYMPGFMRYSTGEPLYAKVSSLTSINSLIPLSYYSLPYCKPPLEVKKSEETTLGELLIGDEIMNSPYRFRVNMNESVYLCTTRPLTKHDVDILKKMTRDMYQVNILLDNLPVVRYVNRHGTIIQWNGFPVGYYWSPSEKDNHYIINHLKFRVSVHEYEAIDKRHAAEFEIVGFEVIPWSVEHDPERTTNASMYADDNGPISCSFRPGKGQIIKEGERVSFSYEVEFVKSQTPWSSRWDSYLKKGGSQVHLFSIINSVVTSLFLMGVIGRIFVRTMTRHGGYQTVDLLDKEAQQTKLSNQILGPELDLNDVFKGPKLKKPLCVMVGIGTQIMATTIFIVTLAAVGFMSPASRGALLMGIISFYLFFGFIGGFVSVYLWKTVKGTPEGWKSTSWYVVSGFPGTVFVIHFGLNLIRWHQNSTGVVPVSVYLMFFSWWLGISVPFTFIGGNLGAQTKQIKCHTHVEWIRREDSARKFRLWFLVLCAGTFPFGTIFIELFFVFSSLFLGRYYYFYGFLLIVLLLLIIICILASAIITYLSLRVEDSRWWWKAFWASGSVAIYMFIYCIKYLIHDLQGLNGPHSAIIYLGYSIIMAISAMLAAGSVGFLGSFCFVNLLSSSKEIDRVSKIFNFIRGSTA